MIIHRRLHRASLEVIVHSPSVDFPSTGKHGTLRAESRSRAYFPAMHLSEHSLRQLDEAYLEALDEAALRVLSAKLLDDLKEARDRLNQGPENSSRPPSSRAPWARTQGGQGMDEDPEDGEPTPAPGEMAKTQAPEAKPTAGQPARKAGKQPGAPGMGRTQVFQAHEEQTHYPTACAGCGQTLDLAGAMAHTGFQSADLRWGNPVVPGLTLWVVRHRYDEASCGCGHHTRALAGQGAVDPLLAELGIVVGGWRVPDWPC